MPTLRPIVTWLSARITQKMSSRSGSAGSTPTSSSCGGGVRGESKANITELGLQPLRRPSSAYVPAGTGMGGEAPPPAERTKRNRTSEMYWPLGAGDGDV